MYNTPGNFIEAIEQSIGRPLLKKELIKNPLEFAELEKLSTAIKKFNEDYRLPVKNENELRPSISPRLKLTEALGFNYVSRIHESPQYSGTFTRELKKYLLYCHSLVIEDPLCYLLDYFRPGCANSQHTLDRIPAVNSLLLEYSGISDLIKSNIIFPVREPFYFENNVPRPDGKLLEDLREKLIEKRINLHQVTEFIFLEQFRKEIFGNNIDSFYPSLDYVTVFKEIMNIRQEKFTTNDIITPFGTNVIGSASLLNLEEISIEDICYMRKHEELFSEWRDFLNVTFKELYHHTSDYSDIDGEFLYQSRMAFTKLDRKINSKFDKAFSHVSLKNTGRKICIGALTGALSGMVTGDAKTALFMSLLNGMMQPSIETVVDMVTQKLHNKEKKVIRHHFLALDIN